MRRTDALEFYGFNMELLIIDQWVYARRNDWGGRGD